MHIIHSERTITYIDYTPTYKGVCVAEFGEETNDRETLKSVLCHRHNHIIHFVLKGSGTFVCDGKTYPLTPGKAFVITPKNLVLYQADEGTSWTYCWIALQGTECETLFHQAGLSGKAVFDFVPEQIEPLLSFVQDLRDCVPFKTTSYPLRVFSMVYEVFSRLAARLCTHSPENKGLTTNIVDTAISYMQASVYKQDANPINISQLCRELNISRTYFSTLFEQRVDQSPYRYLQNMRIQRASELLLNNKELRIYEVAELVGFTTTAQFCKTFQKLLGCSPSEFRGKYKNTTD